MCVCICACIHVYAYIYLLGKAFFSIDYLLTLAYHLSYLNTQYSYLFSIQL